MNPQIIKPTYYYLRCCFSLDAIQYPNRTVIIIKIKSDIKKKWEIVFHKRQDQRMNYNASISLKHKKNCNPFRKKTFTHSHSLTKQFTCLSCFKSFILILIIIITRELQCRQMRFTTICIISLKFCAVVKFVL